MAEFNSPSPSLGQRFVRAMRVAALFSLAIAAVAVVLVAKGSADFHIHMLIATALGVGLSVMLAAALMTLVFLSNKSGHDAGSPRSSTSMGARGAEAARDTHDKKEEQ